MRLAWIAFEPNDFRVGASFAAALGIEFDVFSLGKPSDEGCGAQRIFQANLADSPPADSLTTALKERLTAYSHVAATSSMRSKDVLARLAGLLDAAMVTDVLGCESPTVFTRALLAGSALARVEALASPIVATVRPAGFTKPSPDGPCTSESLELQVNGPSKVVGTSAKSSSRPELSQAKVIVSGGRPLKDAETFERVIGGLADALGGAVGATRAAVDSGIAPNELQVGQTGKIVAPDLYIAAGVSGSTQHMAGIKDSKVIVAINKDAAAPIFEFADVGIVADLYDVVPQLESAARNR